MRLQASATMMPATQPVAAVEPSAASCSARPARSITPVRANPSTITKRPPTSGSTLHDMCFIRFQGACRRSSSTPPAVATPARNVGSPRRMSSADADSRATAARPIPKAASRPPRDRAGLSTRSAMGRRSALRWVNRSTT